MQSSLVSFIQVLRTHDVRISPAETLDAMAVANALGYANRGTLHDGLSLALAKTAEEKAVFSQCFDEFFDHQLADFSATRDEAAASEESEAAADSDQETTAGSAAQSALEQAAAASPELEAVLNSALMQAVMNNDRAELSMAMGQAAEQVGLGDIKMFTQKGQYTRKILDELGEEQIRDAVIALERDDSPALQPLQRYRDILNRDIDAVRYVYLYGDPTLIRQRIVARENHFMPPDLLDSQIAAMEPPQNAIWVAVELPVSDQVDVVRRELQREF